jgi:glycine hydroxymethyltransferase
MKNLAEDTEVFNAIRQERMRQRDTVELIASENFASPAVREAAGTVFTNKYAEGLPGNRYYGGCENADVVEELARDRAKELFGVDWVNVQPHSGAQANAALYLKLMEAGDTFMGLNLSHGGHLTHGSPVNFSGILYNAEYYGVEEDTGRIDMNRVMEQAYAVEPEIISIGASAFPRDFDYEAFREVADNVGALLWMDMAHTAGLIAAGVLNDPMPYADVVTTTTHKTLRGPRGGMILVGEDRPSPVHETKTLGETLDSGVFPGTQGGPLMHIIAAKAVAFKEALQPDFTDYAEQVVANARAMAVELRELGYDLVSGGTDNHLVLVDLTDTEFTGKEAEELLEGAGITANKNLVPYDSETPFVTSGIRLGTPAMTTRGFGEDEFREVARMIDAVLESPNANTQNWVRHNVKDLCRRHMNHIQQ